MKRHRYIWISLAVAATAVAISFILWPSEKEPRYQGKTVEEWLSSLKGNSFADSQSEISALLTELGSNAVPSLIRILDQNKTPTKNWFATNALQAEWMPGFIHSIAAKHLDTLPYWAGHALGHLGTNAAIAIPDLERIICDPEKERGWEFSAVALGNIGPTALPALQRCLTNAPSGRQRVLTYITLLTLKRALQSNDHRVREDSALGLTELSKPPFELIPILAEIVEGDDMERSKRALRALGRWMPELAPNYMPARDAIEKAARCDDIDTRRLATEVLAKLPYPKAP